MTSISALTPEQKQMDAIFENFFKVSDALRDDVTALLDRRDDDDPVWRRAFIRAIVPLIEGFAYSFLSICHANPELCSVDREKVEPDQKKTTPNQIKRALKSIYHQLELSPAPDFCGIGWSNSQRLFSARNALMHPKTVNDLVYTESDWEHLCEGGVWLTKEIFRVPDLLNKKFGDGAGSN